MIRVYLDWNIFSYLRHFGSVKEPFITLNKNLSNYKEGILIPYTAAHLSDLIPSYKSSERGKTETKADLDYLAELSDHHCIIYDYKEQRTYCDNYDLYDYFEQLLESSEFQFNSIEELLLLGDYPELKELSQTFVDVLKSMPMGIDFSTFPNYQGMNPQFLDIFSNTLTGGSFYDVFSDTIKMINEYNNNHKVYRGVRNATLDELKLNYDYSNSKEPIDDISKHLQSSAFNKTFKEFSETNLKSYHRDKEPSRFDIFINDYILLDYLGFYKDQKFKNLIQDSFHAYYGAHCDFFVTDDRNTYHKAKVIYKLFNIDTIVCTSEEFNTKFFGKVILNPNNDSPLSEIIAQTIKTGFVISKKHDRDFNPVDVFKIDNYILNFFNRLQLTHNADSSTSIYLYKKTQNYSQFYFWIEVETIVNKIVKQFGVDVNMRHEFNFSVDKAEIRDNKWKGRHWAFGKVNSSIEWDKEFGIMLVLHIENTKSENYGSNP